jgi:hypothetical protein
MIRVLENIKSKKVSRKNFIFYSGIALAGVYMLIKRPFKFFGKKEREEVSVRSEKGIRFESNPEAVKRN